MRELKFRAWDEQRKIMHDNFQCIKSGDQQTAQQDWIIPIEPLTNTDWIIRLEEHVRSAPHCRQQFHIMQYTGLKDKNGKEIYEHDFVKSKDHNPDTYLIEFREGGFCASSANKDAYPIDINHFYPSIGCCIEVVGNKFET